MNPFHKKNRNQTELPYHLLEYILANDSIFSPVELSPFLLKNFENDPLPKYMNRIRNFIEEMENYGLIKISERHSLRISTAKTEHKELYAYAKITNQGITFLSERNAKKLNKTSILTSIIIGIIVMIVSIATLLMNYSDNQSTLDKIEKSVEKYIQPKT